MATETVTTCDGCFRVIEQSEPSVQVMYRPYGPSESCVGNSTYDWCPSCAPVKFKSEVLDALSLKSAEDKTV